MKLLKQLIQDIPAGSITGSVDVPVSMLAIDSRRIERGGLFFARKGTLTDGHQYIEKVADAGAVAVICEYLPVTLNEDVCYILVADVSAVIGLVAAAFYDHPTKNMKVIGVTGTNGKTTVATLLFRLFRTSGQHCGLVSTVQNQIDEEIIPATHTTPDPVSLQGLFRKMADRQCSYVFMEVSSHAIAQKRIAGIRFSGGIFTNITHDHLDYHKTFDEYIRVKKSFFDELPESAFALSNLDDKRGAVMLQNTRAVKKYYALRKPADFKGKVISNTLEGLQMEINKQEVHFLLNGLFNAYNLLAVYGAAVCSGENTIEALTTLSGLKGASGRFDTYRSAREGILGIVDYAHTPDALLNVLATIRQFESKGKVVTVVGCGGDRDKTKRPEMAQVACLHSDRVILTSDNPRSEDPEAILDDMEAGLAFAQKKKILRIADRKEAIKAACSLAAFGDIILIAGKGHENYQEIKGIKNHFDDKETLLQMFQLLDK